MTAVKIALALFDLGAGIFRRVEARAKIQHERVMAYNQIIRGMKAGDDLAVCVGFERLSTVKKSRTVGGGR